MKIQLLLAFATLFQWFCMALRYDKLLEESRKNFGNVIELTDTNYKRILGTPRDSYILVFLTASAPQVGCSICLEAADEFKMIANSWFKDHPDAVSKKGREAKSLFFAKSDLKDPQHIPQIFQFYSLQHVPRLFLFAPGGDMQSYQIIDLAGNAGKDRALQLISSLKAETKIEDFVLHLPVDWSLSIAVAFVTFTVVYLFKRHSELMSRLFSLRPLWAVSWTFFVILMLGGYMYNNIRNAQLAGVGSKGEIMYFLPGQSQHQFKIETQVVGVIYASLTASLLALIVGIPKLRDHYQGSSSMTLLEVASNILLAAIVYAFFAGLTSVFSIKQPGYPFQLMKLSSLFK
ncbi:hypothetical protein HG536_0B02620 [Torulaspora globosa]|uniref:Dolichyl-diphosphooligosaccharide--protein glycosyltransferase subunit 3 n=1 Tax=Torulaspora globosa TaxID=48254 RepID=A0A7G3ZD13_9SACH|nr:uncharacterized protein HG536_0B02620 [Torulaspora globosa]QLL31399.1 hypothetical protein HG536_0B02620 [Torulaspora globosa]